MKKKHAVMTIVLFLPVLSLLVHHRDVHAKKDGLSTQQIQVLQTKEFEAGCPLTFKSVMNALQDNNFQVKDADQKAGFVYAQTGGKRSFLMGTVKNVDTSITFNDISKNTCAVRANFFEVVSRKSAGFLAVLTTVAFGTGTGVEAGYEQAKLITKSDVYDRFYAAVRKHLFLKEALNHP